jgi:hypothetical protein
MLYNFKNTNEVRNVWLLVKSLHHVLKTHTVDFKLVYSVHDHLILSITPVSLPLVISDMQ